MGNSSRNPEDYDIVRNYRSQEWQPCLSTSSPPQLWRNRKTHQLAEVYRLYSIPSIEDMNRYEMRSTQQNFVKVYHIALSPNRALCFSQQYVRLLIEYIPVKLQNVSGLQLQEALTILIAVFKGFNTLSNNFGLIQPQEELIGFNQWGKAKIWLNKQHDHNFPPHSLPAYLDKSRVQASHVRKIFDLIEKKTQIGQLPIKLKESFRINNPCYLQAVLIVQQFAYQNLLSLQRFIRTDLYTRKSNQVRQANQSREIRRASHEKCSTVFTTSVQPFPRPQLKRMHSFESLHAQRVVNHSQSTLSFASVPFKENLNHHSGHLVVNNNTKSTIPKISFQRACQTGSFVPFLNHKSNSSTYPTEIVKPQLSKDTSEHVKYVSILSAPFSETPSPSKIQQIQPNEHVQTPNNKLQHLRFEQINQVVQKQQETKRQTPNLQVEDHKIQSNANISCNTINQDQTVPDQQTCRSIIDKVDSEISSDNIKELQSPRYEQQEDDDFQVSGTFNYKALYERDNIVPFDNALEQIGEEDDCSKDRQCEEESKIKQKDVQHSIEYQEDFQKQEENEKQNIPINFQSFAPVKLLQHHLVSFAPNQTSFPTEESIQNEEVAQTSKSFEYDESRKRKTEEQVVRSIDQLEESIPEPCTTIVNMISKEQKAQEEEMQRIMQAKKRVSIDLYYPQNSQTPFYTHYTPVQSKFDVVIKRESTLSNETERHERPSAFAHLDSYQQIENYVRNKYLGGNMNAYSETVKVGRVQSQYEKHYIKEPESYDFAKKDLQKKTLEKQNNRGYLRSPNNKISNILQKPEEDFLDVNFLERSLDKRYSADIKKALRTKQEEDQLNIAKLDEGLMKFSTSKASITEKSSKEQKVFEPSEPKNDSKNVNEYISKWENSTGFEYQARTKQPSLPSEIKKKKKAVTIENAPTHQFVYQLSSSDYGNFKGFSKPASRSPCKESSFGSDYKTKHNESSKITQQSKVSKLQKQNMDDRYNKYVKNAHRTDRTDRTDRTERNYNPPVISNSSINQMLSVKGQSRLMLSPIPERRYEDDAKLSYDQLRSFLWG